MVFQKGLIDSHALFSPWKIDNALKFEPSADQILKGPMKNWTQKMNWLVLSFFRDESVTSSSTNRSADRFGHGCSNLKVLPVYDL
jgi:hypothetical protein